MVAVDYAAFDMGTGVSAVLFIFAGSSGQEFQVKTGVPATDAGTAIGAIPAWAPSGAYTLEFISVWDNAENAFRYERDGQRVTHPSGAVGSHAFDLAAADFTVDNANGDAQAAVVSSLARTSADTIAPGDEVTVGFEVSDDVSGVFSVSFAFTGPTGNWLSAGAGDVSVWAPLTGPAKGTVPGSTPAGPYRLTTVTVDDKAFNRTEYLRDGTTKLSPSLVSGPSSHTLDFAAADFTVANPNGDTSTPVLSSLGAALTTVIGPGGTVRIPFSASDTGRGMRFVFMNFYGPTGNLLSAEAADPADGPATLVVPDYAPSGVYRLMGVLLFDADLNRSQYLRDGSVLLDPPGASGPTANPFTLAIADFTIINGPVPTTTTTTEPPVQRAPQITTGAGAGGGPHVRSFAANGVGVADEFLRVELQLRGRRSRRSG